MNNRFSKQDKDTQERTPASLREGVIAGRNAVLEALKGGTLEKLYVATGELEGSVVRILSLAKEKKIPVTRVDRVKLDFIAGTRNHQGVVAYAAQKEYVTLDKLLENAAAKGEPPFLIVADGIEDPHNLGAILRTAEAAGVHGVVVSRHNSVGVTPAVTKASAGAVFHVDIAKVNSIPNALDELKKKGVWIYGTDAAGNCPLYKTDITGPAAFVIGSEGSGMNRLTAEKCDFLLSIPLHGQVNSLNASVAAGVLIFEALRQRGQEGK